MHLLAHLFLVYFLSLSPRFIIIIRMHVRKKYDTISEKENFYDDDIIM
jgi:hypothetical protein